MSDEKPNRSKRMQNEISKLESLIAKLEQPKQEVAIQFGALPPLCSRCQDLEKHVKILEKSLSDTQKINQELEIDLRTAINEGTKYRDYLSRILDTHDQNARAQGDAKMKQETEEDTQSATLLASLKQTQKTAECEEGKNPNYHLVILLLTLQNEVQGLESALTSKGKDFPEHHTLDHGAQDVQRKGFRSASVECPVDSNRCSTDVVLKEEGSADKLDEEEEEEGRANFSFWQVEAGETSAGGFIGMIEDLYVRMRAGSGIQEGGVMRRGPKTQSTSQSGEDGGAVVEVGDAEQFLEAIPGQRKGQLGRDSVSLDEDEKSTPSPFPSFSFLKERGLLPHHALSRSSSNASLSENAAASNLDDLAQIWPIPPCTLDRG